MANQKKDRRRSRKRRRGTATAASATAVKDAAGGQAELQSRSGKSSRTQPSRAKRANNRPREVDNSGRPQAPWHPLPLSELLILAGMIGTIFGVRDLKNVHSPADDPALLAGVIVLSLGTFEFTLREHLGGFRSHTIMLAVIPVVLLDSLVLLVTAAFTTPPEGLEIGMLAIDVILFGVLFRLMRARFLDSRRTLLFNRNRRR